MSFTWPAMLLSLLLVPVLAAGYVWLMRRRAAAAPALGPLRVTDGGGGRRAAWRRHLAPALFLAALALMLAALARPTVVVALPHREGTVILAFDVSTSMEATDLAPTRMAAAKQAADAFVRDQPSSVRIGVVAFSDSAFVLQQPTNDQGDVLAAIDRIEPQGGTSLSEGMFSSLGAIAGHPIALASGTATATAAPDPASTNIGYYGSAVIVLLSDGEDTSRVDPLGVAQVAANAGVRVFPIGLGSPDGATLDIQGYQVATALNEPLLSKIADTTGGTYFRAEDAAKLKQVYGRIDLQLAVRGEELEATPLVAVVAMLLLVVGAGLTMRWFGRVP